MLGTYKEVKKIGKERHPIYMTMPIICRYPIAALIIGATLIIIMMIFKGHNMPCLCIEPGGMIKTLPFRLLPKL